MMNKTRKSIQKRAKISPKGKVLLRKPGKNHFNAKARRKRQLQLKRWQQPRLDQKTIREALWSG